MPVCIAVNEMLHMIPKNYFSFSNLYFNGSEGGLNSYNTLSQLDFLFVFNLYVSYRYSHFCLQEKRHQ